MHEVGLMEQVLRAASTEATRQGAGRIITIRLRIGGLSGVVPEALECAFAVLSGTSMAAGGRLEWEAVDPAAWCEVCRLEFPVNDLLYECPRCGVICPELRRGRELEISSIEIE